MSASGPDGAATDPQARQSQKSVPNGLFPSGPIDDSGKTGSDKDDGQIPSKAAEIAASELMSPSKAIVHATGRRRNICDQAGLLFNLIWTLKKRKGKCTFACEVVCPFLSLFGLMVLYGGLTIAWKVAQTAQGASMNNYGSQGSTGPEDLLIHKASRLGMDKDSPSEKLYRYLTNAKYVDRIKGNLGTDVIHVASDDTFSRDFTAAMSAAWKNSQAGNDLKFKFYESKEKLVQTFYKNNDAGLGLILPSSFKSENNFDYKILTTPSLPIPHISSKRWPCLLKKETVTACPARAYLSTNFLALQSVVEQAIVMQRLGKSNSTPKVKLEATVTTSVPKTRNGGQPRDSEEETDRDFGEQFFKAIILMPFSQSSSFAIAGLLNSLVVFLVADKASKMKEGLKMMGMSVVAYWSAWFGMYTLITVGIVGCYCVAYVFLLFPEADAILFVLLYTSYGVANLAFGLLLSTILNKPEIAGVSVVWYLRALLIATPFIAFAGYQEAFLPLNLIHVYAYQVGAIELGSQHFGRTWFQYIAKYGRVWTADVDGIWYSIIFLAADTVLYLALALYLDAIFPGEFGAKKPYCFCFMPSYWSSKSRLAQVYADLVSSASVTSPPDVEPISGDMIGKEAIRIRDVWKVYQSFIRKNSVAALKGVSLDIYQGQITAILGRNGAGKTTLFNILLGLVSPTKGNAIVFGLDTGKGVDMERIRKLVGVCLQQDLHYPDLTVEEHMQFFGQLRGLGRAESSASGASLLEKLNMATLRATRAKDLSGGQKRKLSIAIALLGDPPIVMLDEPTAGLDPVSRRHLWDVLRSRKEGKVILLTTHFMDEADVLADRKAIIHEGVIKCGGSSLYLKNRFGVGYHISVNLNEKHKNFSKIDTIVEKYVPSALRSKKIIAKTATYSIPLAEVSSLPPLLAEIEEEKKDGGQVKGLGVEMTTLEEVFLQIAYKSDVKDETTEEFDMLQESVVLKQNSCAALLMLLKLRLLRLLRSPSYLFLTVLLPILITLGIFGYFYIVNTRAKKELSKPVPEVEYGRIGVHESGTDLADFLKQLGVKVSPFSGDVESFWRGAGQPGNFTLGSISIDNKEFSATQYHLKASISVNGEYLHSQPVTFNLLTKYFNRLAEKGPVTYRKGTSSLSYGQISAGRELTPRTEFALGFATFLVFVLSGVALALASSGMMVEMVQDKEIKTRNHLRLNGVNFWLYYSSLFLAFELLMLILVVAMVGLLTLFVREQFGTHGIILISIMILVNTIPQLLFASVTSYFFSSVAQAEAAFMIMAVFLSFTAITTVLGLRQGADIFGSSTNLMRAHYIFSAFDVYYVPGSTLLWLMHHLEGENINNFNFKDFWSKEILIMLISMCVQLPVLAVVLYALDLTTKGGTESILRFCQKSSSGVASSALHADEIPEDDVEVEKLRVAQYFAAEPNPNCVLAVRELWKGYDTQIALQGISFMVEQGEILGILGHNGAGKTTTVRIITAEETSDGGDVSMCGLPITSHHSEIFKLLGYCPQHDALWKNITLQEHIELYSVFHGVSSRDRKRLIPQILTGLSIEEHKQKYSQNLSGGTKRKLSYAMSMIGFPSIVLMDEPSTGMDPQSKRFLWNTILGSFKSSRGATLTTHSMEEADVLCTRIALLVKGRMVAIGTPQSLKNKFGQGYTLEVKLPVSKQEAKPAKKSSTELKPNKSKSETKKGNQAATGDFTIITANFPGCKLLESFGHRAVFSVPLNAIQSVSQTFALLEKLKSEEKIEEYAFSQTTLEQVYLTICQGVEGE